MSEALEIDRAASPSGPGCRVGEGPELASPRHHPAEQAVPGPGDGVPADRQHHLNRGRSTVPVAHRALPRPEEDS